MCAWFSSSCWSSSLFSVWMAVCCAASLVSKVCISWGWYCRRLAAPFAVFKSNCTISLPWFLNHRVDRTDKGTRWNRTFFLCGAPPGQEFIAGCSGSGQLGCRLKGDQVCCNNAAMPAPPLLSPRPMARALSRVHVPVLRWGGGLPPALGRQPGATLIRPNPNPADN